MKTPTTGPASFHLTLNGFVVLGTESTDEAAVRTAAQSYQDLTCLGDELMLKQGERTVERHIMGVGQF